MFGVMPQRARNYGVDADHDGQISKGELAALDADADGKSPRAGVTPLIQPPPAGVALQSA